MKPLRAPESKKELHTPVLTSTCVSNTQTDSILICQNYFYYIIGHYKL